MNTENKQIQFVFSNGKILKVERGLFLEIFSKIEKIHIYKGDLIDFSSGKNFATE